MFINKISFGTIRDGLHAGWLAYNLTLTGDPVDSRDDFYEDILKVTNHKSPIPYVTLEGAFTVENATDCLTLAKTLTDMGYKIRAVSSGDTYHSWFTLVHHLLVKVTTEKWAMFNVGELHYHMTNALDPIPYLPQNKNIPKYIDPAEDISPEALLAFLKKSTEPWAILLRTKKNYLEVLKETT